MRAATLPIFLTLALLLVTALASAAPAATEPMFTYGPWHHSIIGGGGYVQNVVLAPSDPLRAYSYVDNSGIFRSDDGGRTWRMIHAGLPAAFGIYDVRGVIVDPRNADKIVAAIGGQWDEPKGIFVSDDGGGTWQQTLKACFFGSDEFRSAGFILQRRPDQPDELLAASGKTGVFRSTDNGRTWTHLGMDGLYPTDLKYDAARPARVWMCALPVKLTSGMYRDPLAGGFFRSDDGGATWKKLADTSPEEILQDPKDRGRIYGTFGETAIRTSTDGGETWTDFGAGLALAKPGEKPNYTHENRYRALAAGPDFIVAGSANGSFYRLDCGQTTWRKIEREGVEQKYAGREWFASEALGVRGHFGQALGSITVDPKQPDRWFFTDFYGVYQTVDGGRHWALSSDGIDATVLFSLAQDPADPAIVHMGMADNGHFRSDDGGVRFIREPTGNQNAKCLSVSPADPARLYAMGSGLGGDLAGMKSVQVWVSSDRGQTWVASPMIGLPPMGTRCACTIEPDSRDPMVAYLGLCGSGGRDNGGVWRTEDGGRSWKWFSDGLPEGKWFFRAHVWNIGREIAAGPDGTVVVFGSEGVWRRAAADAKWTRAEKQPSGGPNAVVADPKHPGRFYLAAEGNGGGVFRSDDAGRTWTNIYKGSSRHVAVDAANPDRIAAGLLDGVVYSLDAGHTWTEADRRLPYRFQPLVAFAGDRLLAGTVGNGCFWIALTPAGEKPVQARPVTPAYRTAAALAAPMLSNGSMTEGDAVPAGWTDPWAGKAGAAGAAPAAAPRLRVRRDTQEFKSAPASLVVETTGGHAEGTLTRTIAVPAGSTDQPLMAGGWIRTTGRLTQATLSAYCTGPDQPAAWRFIANGPATGEWTEFYHTISLPPGITQIRLQLSLRGEGKVWLDDLNVAPVRVWNAK